jgi:hypothetical protein
MPSSKKKLSRIVILAAPLMLAACGDGWEMVRVSDVVPYGNTRTAGTGVAYVRAKMLPQKELKLESSQPVITPVPAPAPMTPPPPPPPTKAEEIFRDQQSK